MAIDGPVVCPDCIRLQAQVDQQLAALEEAAPIIALVADLSNAVRAAKKQPFSPRCRNEVKRLTNMLLRVLVGD